MTPADVLDAMFHPASGLAVCGTQPTGTRTLRRSRCTVVAMTTFTTVGYASLRSWMFAKIREVEHDTRLAVVAAATRGDAVPRRDLAALTLEVQALRGEWLRLGLVVEKHGGLTRSFPHR